MSFIKDPNLAENIDNFRTWNMLNDVSLTDQQKDAAWSTLQHYGALDLADMLGLREVPG